MNECYTVYPTVCISERREPGISGPNTDQFIRFRRWSNYGTGTAALILGLPNDERKKSYNSFLCLQFILLKSCHPTTYDHGTRTAHGRLSGFLELASRNLESERTSWKYTTGTRTKPNQCFGRVGNHFFHFFRKLMFYFSYHKFTRSHYVSPGFLRLEAA